MVAHQDVLNLARLSIFCFPNLPRSTQPCLRRRRHVAASSCPRTAFVQLPPHELTRSHADQHIYLRCSTFIRGDECSMRFTDCPGGRASRSSRTVRLNTGCLTSAAI